MPPGLDNTGAPAVESSNEGVTLKVYRGEGSALLTFDVDPKLADDLAGFAVHYATPECGPPARSQNVSAPAEYSPTCAG